VRLFPDFVFQKQGKAAIWANPKLLANINLDLIANPDRLFACPDCEVVKDQLKVKVGRITLTIDGVATGIYVKRYNAFSTRYRIASLVLSSGAVKALRGAGVLSQAGISTGKPLAAVELRSGGMLKGSFFVTEEIRAGKTADDYWQNNLMPIKGAEGFKHRRKFLKSLAELFSQLHRLGIYHNDLKDANILVTANVAGSESFVLLDLEGVRGFRYLSMRRRVKNLVQINRTLGKFLSQTEKLHFLNWYLRRDSGDKSTQIRWISDIQRGTERADHKSLAKTRGRNGRNCF